MSKPNDAGYLNVFTVEEFDTGKGRTARSWTKIGVAFPHQDGAGFNIELRAFPRDGRLVVLPPLPSDRGEEARASEQSDPKEQVG